MLSNAMEMSLSGPILRWDEAIPLGNGLWGVLLWGDGQKLKLSLDRGDLWDERMNGIPEHPLWNYPAIRDIVKCGDRAQLQAFDELYDKIPATKLPVGRLELDYEPDCDCSEFFLDMTYAEATVYNRKREGILQIYCAADGSGIFFKTAGVQPAHVKIVPPDYANGAPPANPGFEKSAATLGYEPGVQYSDKQLQYYIQPCDQGMHYGIFVEHRLENEWKVSILKADSAEDMEKIILQIKAAVTQDSYSEKLSAHREFWSGIWSRAQVDLPDPALTQYYNLCRYLFASCSRRGAPPMPLQGVWTADDNTLPPWRGDYHHDLNTQGSYCSYLTSGDIDGGCSFLDHLVSQMDMYRQFGRTFYQVDALAVPGVATLKGQALGGWPMYSFSPTNSAWLAMLFADHFYYTVDHQFLEQQALPFCEGVGQFLLQLLEENEKGEYFLPLSSSPEIHDNTLEAYLTPTSNYDLSLIMRLFRDLEALQQAAGNEERSNYWAQQQKKLPDLAVDAQTGLMLSPDEQLQESHRHFAPLMAIWPLKLLTKEHDKELIQNSLLHLQKLGTDQWVGYSFAWVAAFEACLGNGNGAMKWLTMFLDGFLSRNGFHLNGDFKDLGYSSFKYRPFTLEANFMAVQVIHEMLLQTCRSQYQIFPALPAEWTDLSFSGLYGEGGIKISAELKNGKISSLILEGSCNSKIVLWNPARKDEILFLNGTQVQWENGKIALTFMPGTRYEFYA